ARVACADGNRRRDHASCALGYRAPSRPGAGGAQPKPVADPFGGRAQLRRDEAVVRLPAGPLPGTGTQCVAASSNVHRDQSAPRAGARRRLSMPPALRCALRPSQLRQNSHPPAKKSSPSPLTQLPATHPGYAKLSCKGEGIRIRTSYAKLSCKGEDEGEGPCAARYCARFKILPPARRDSYLRGALIVSPSMRDFRDKGRNPRFNRNAPSPPRRDSPASTAKPATAPPPGRDYRRADAGERETRRASGNDSEIVYGVEPIRELVAAAPASIRVLYVKSGDERRFAAEIDLVRTGGGRVEFADEAGLERLAGPTARHQGIAALMRE